MYVPCCSVNREVVLKIIFSYERIQCCDGTIHQTRIWWGDPVDIKEILKVWWFVFIRSLISLLIIMEKLNQFAICWISKRFWKFSLYLSIYNYVQIFPLDNFVSDFKIKSKEWLKYRFKPNAKNTHKTFYHLLLELSVMPNT